MALLSKCLFSLFNRDNKIKSCQNFYSAFEIVCQRSALIKVCFYHFIEIQIISKKCFPRSRANSEDLNTYSSYRFEGVWGQVIKLSKEPVDLFFKPISFFKHSLFVRFYSAESSDLGEEQLLIFPPKAISL